MDDKVIIYGGAFNPPTIGHLGIIKYLVKKFTDCKIIILPTNNFYKSSEIESYYNRKQMIEIMCKDFLDKIEVSDYEQTLDKYYGTYYTLRHFNHPYFVIGADSLETLHTWIKYPLVLTENKFIVFPRDNVNLKQVINNDELLKEYENNFIICDDFKEIEASSTAFRDEFNEEVISKEVLNYIKEHNLYKINKGDK